MNKRKSGAQAGQAAGNDQGLRMKSAIDGSASPMMMVDRDLVITYANPATMEMITKNLESFRKAFPGFDPSRLVGATRAGMA